MALSEDEEFELLSLEREKYATKSSNSSQRTDAILAGGALVGAAGLYGAARYINTPNRLTKPIDIQLKEMTSLIPSKNPISTSDLPSLLKQNYESSKLMAVADIDSKLKAIASSNFPNSPNVAVDELPSLLGAKFNQFKANTVVPSLNAINQGIKVQAAQVKQNRNLFDQKIVEPAIDDIAKHIADNYKVFTQSAYDNYRAVQNNVENIIEQSGAPLQSSDIASKLIDKTIADAGIEGVPEDKLSALKKLSNSFNEASTGTITDLKGAPLDISKPIPFSQIKGNVQYLLDGLPDKAKFVLAKNWGDFMQQYAPQEANQAFQAMQDSYSKFAPIRNALYDFIDRDSGSFNTKTLSTRLRMLVRNNQDAGLTQTLEALSNGTDIAKPIPGLLDKASKLPDLSSQRNEYATHLINLEKSKQSAIEGANKVQEMLQQGTQQYTDTVAQTKNLLSQKSAVMQRIDQQKVQAVQQAEMLLSQRQAITEKMPIRTFLSRPQNLLKAAGKLATGAGKLAVGLPFGTVQDKMMKGSVGYDPAEAFQTFLEMKTLNPNNPNQARKIDELIKKLKDGYNSGQQI